MIVGGILITLAVITYFTCRSSNKCINKHSLKYYKLKWRCTPPF